MSISKWSGDGLGSGRGVFTFFTAFHSLMMPARLEAGTDNMEWATRAHETHCLATATANETKHSDRTVQLTCKSRCCLHV